MSIKFHKRLHQFNSTHLMKEMKKICKFHFNPMLLASRISLNFKFSPFPDTAPASSRSGSSVGSVRSSRSSRR